MEIKLLQSFKKLLNLAADLGPVLALFPISLMNRFPLEFFVFFKKNGPSPASFSFIFGLFQTNNTIFTTNQCEKMSTPSSIWCRDSNPQPLEREAPPITTRLGLPPSQLKMLK